jgi:hypothetical protein
MSTSKIETSPNWCSTVDSPTYKLTWYIVNSDVFNNPLLLNNIPDKHNASDNAAIRSNKAVIIASSGETSEYSIENLVIQSRISPGTDTGNTTTGAFQFDIYEPGGFEFMHRILKLSHIFKFGSIQSARYVLKVEFVGRNISNSAPVKFPGVFYYPMMISNISASSGPEGSQYNIVAANQHKIALMSSKVVTDIKLSGITTVKSFLDKLTVQLNEHEQSIRKRQITDGSVLNAKTWAYTIKNGSPPDTLSFQQYMESYMTTAQVDMTGTGHSNDLGEDFSAQFNIDKGAYMVDYILNTLTKQVPDYYNTFNDEIAANSAKNKKDIANIKTILSGEGDRAKQIIEYNNKYFYDFITVTPTITYGEEIDSFTNTPQEFITLEIGLKTSYTTPKTSVAFQKKLSMNASYQARRLELLPIYKSYNFLFTGNNSEVLDFNLDYDMMFYMTRDPSEGAGYTATTKNMGQGETVKVTSNIPVNLSGISANPYDPNTQIENITYVIEGTDGKKQNGSTEQNAITAAEQAEIYAASMDFIKFEITIKGDPFWLGTPGSYTTASKNMTLKENLNEDALIVFINYLPDNGKTNVARRLDISSSGVYVVQSVENKFQLGKFTQSLTARRDRNSSTDLIQQRLKKIGSQNGN